MKRKQAIIGILLITILAAVVFYFTNGRNDSISISENYAAASQNASYAHTDHATIKVEQVWELPRELFEISANVYIDKDRMACIQDNKGIIYIYNLKTKLIDGRITFAGNGDFEGLSLVGETYYALRSDGFLFEVNSTGSGNPQVKTYDLPLKAENDTEPMCYDRAHKRLLIGNKEKDLSGGDGKSIYSFDLATKRMSTVPVVKISADGDGSEEGANAEGGGDNKKKKNNGNDDKKDKKKGKKGKGDIKPSEIALHPQNGELYILNGPQSQLLIADASGRIKSVVRLDKQIFPQPEGMTFTPAGELYISSEGSKNGAAVIAKVRL